MPLYDYRCTECGREVEVMHGIDGHGPATCETCGGAMRKALSTPAVHFKGSGWAKKDAQAAAKAKAKSSSPAASKPSVDGKAGSETSGSETKKETTSDTAKPKDSAKSSSPTAKTTD
jgi:putative FmdB family regulatory protein